MDWADELVEEYKKRGESISADNLRTWLKQMCEGNVKRQKSKWENKEEKQKATEEETKRLIELKRHENKLEQFEYDYKLQGIKIKADYHQKEKIAEVELMFSPEEWVDFLNAEGELLPHCCADISRIRNILQNTCRNNYFINAEDLFELVYLIEQHGFEDHPINKVTDLWEKIKKDVRQRNIIISVNLENPTDALQALSEAASVISWDDMLCRSKDVDYEFERKVKRSAALATVKTAVRTLFFKLQEMDTEPIEGYGIVCENKIAHTRRGLAIFRTESIAQEICDTWNASEEKIENYCVKKVRVCMEKGLEIIDQD